MKLPPGQRRILILFADAEDQGRQASRAEIAQAVGYAFPSAVSKHVEALVRKGLLVSDRAKKRNVRLSPTGWAAINRSPSHGTAAPADAGGGHGGIPVIGAIAAGTPILAEEHITEVLTDLAPQRNRIALKVRGDSMRDAGILDGDFAVIELDQPVSDGTIGAVVVDEEATLKRVRRDAQRLVLEPCNPDYQPIVVESDDAARRPRVVGPLAFVYRRVR